MIGFEAYLRNDAGLEIVPADKTEWRYWVSASKTRNWCLPRTASGTPLGKCASHRAPDYANARGWCRLNTDLLVRHVALGAFEAESAPGSHHRKSARSCSMRLTLRPGALCQPASLAEARTALGLGRTCG